MIKPLYSSDSLATDSVHVYTSLRAMLKHGGRKIAKVNMYGDKR